MKFFKSFAATKVDYVSSDFSDWRYNLNKYILPSIDGTLDLEQTAISPVSRPYANAKNEEDIYENEANGTIFFLLRREVKAVSVSMLKKRFADYEIRNGSKPSRDTKADIKSKLYETAPVKIDFIPIIVDRNKSALYIFSSSGKMIEEAKDVCSHIFEFEYEEKETSIPSTFLTWLWWRMENTQGSLVTIDGDDVEIFIGESVKCASGTGSISAKKVLEEARASLSKGADVNEIEVTTISSSGPRDVIFTSMIDTLKGLEIVDPDKEEETRDLQEPQKTIEYFEKASKYTSWLFEVRDDLLKLYEKEAHLITDELRQNWGLKKFCPMLIGSF